MIELIQYSPEYSVQWDDVITDAANGHFMFQRLYMDYHKDRHEDASYIIFNKGTAIAVIPGTKVDKRWISHGGLTFGGLIIKPKYSKIAQVMEIYNALFEQLKQIGFDSALIKPLPWIYHSTLGEAEIYAIHKCTNYRAHTMYETTTTIELERRAPASKLRVRKKNKAAKSQLKISKTKSFSAFYDVLQQRLNDKYEKAPVHTLEELELLASRFPNNISLYTVEDDSEETFGGCVIYSSNDVWHSQYVSATEKGMEQGALDLLFFELIELAKGQKARYFDFGISTEDNGRYLNESLISFKEGFGGRSVMHQKIHICLSE